MAGCLLVISAVLACGSTPRMPRPAGWAQPVLCERLGNCYRVNQDLYRSEQPHRRDIADLKALGIQTLISLRGFHADSTAFGESGMRLIAHRMRAGSASAADLVAVLRDIRTADKPVLVHCWHGSDRTGFIVAGYRIVVEDWTPQAAIEELRAGGFGFHEAAYRNIVEALQALDVQAVRKAVFAP